MASKRVLVVDDDAAIRQMFTILLRRNGYEVEAARDGSEGLLLIRDHEYCAVILDLMMPVTSGFEMLEILKHEKPDALQRIIITTGVSRNDLSKLDSSCVFALIRKPFDIHELLRKVGECSSRYEYGAINCRTGEQHDRNSDTRTPQRSADVAQ